MNYTYLGATVSKWRYRGVVRTEDVDEFMKGVEDAEIGIPPQGVGDYLAGYNTRMEYFVFSFISEGGKNFVTIDTDEKRFPTELAAIRSKYYPMALHDSWDFIYKKSRGRVICSVDGGETWHFNKKNALDNKYGIIRHAINNSETWQKIGDFLQEQHKKSHKRLVSKLTLNNPKQQDIFDDTSTSPITTAAAATKTINSKRAARPSNSKLARSGS